MNLGFELHFRSDLVRYATAPAVEPLEHRGAVLLLGAFPPDVDAELRRLEIEVVRVASTHDALKNLAAMEFHSFAVSPDVDGAFELVKQLKARRNHVDDDLAWQAASRNLMMPVVVLPFAGDDEYAVIVAAPVVAFLERTSRVALSYALLRVDVARLLKNPLAKN